MTKWLALLSVLLLGACASPPEYVHPERKTADDFLANAVTAYSEHDFLTAKRAYQEALVKYRALDLSEQVVQTHYGLFYTHLSLGLGQAAKYHHDAALFYREHGGVGSSRRATLVQAQWQLYEGNAEAAVVLLDELLLPRLKENKSWSALDKTALQERIDVALRLNDDDASVWVDRYRHIAKSDDEQAKLWRYDARLSQDLAQQRRYYQQALTFYHQQHARPAIDHSLREWAQAEMAQGNWEEAIYLLQRATNVSLSLYDRKGLEEGLSLMREAYTQLNRDDVSQAIEQAMGYLNDGEEMDWAALSDYVIAAP